MIETLSSNTMSTSLLRLAMLGRKKPKQCFTNLNQYLTKDLLRAAFHQVRKDGAVGIDGQTAAEYAQTLEGNLDSLLVRAKTGGYFAPPVRRSYIPKVGGRRPIGVPTFEDKVLQRAIVMILEKLYEPIFHPHSFGYRLGGSAGQALDTMRSELSKAGGGYVIELDIKSFFDSMDKSKLREFLQLRIGDGVILRLINKWLKAGVLEGDLLHYPETGTSQGGVISPILANVYLHYVLDEWFEEQAVPRLINQATIIRFADDAVIILRNQKDMDRVMKVLPKRFSSFGLTLHPDKTCQTVFKPKERSTIDFLGFTHYWKRGRNRQWGICRKTMKSRFARGLRAIKVWCRFNRHLPIPEQYQKLCRKVRGHFAYFGMSGNYEALKRFRFAALRIWMKWLRRRSQRHRWTTERLKRFYECYSLPTPKIKRKATMPANVMI